MGSGKNETLGLDQGKKMVRQFRFSKKSVLAGLACIIVNMFI